MTGDRAGLVFDRDIPTSMSTTIFSQESPAMIAKQTNQKAWFMVLPVFLVVAFSAVIPLMTVVNYSVQDTFGNNVFLGRHGLVQGSHPLRTLSCRLSQAAAVFRHHSGHRGTAWASSSPWPCRKRGWGVPVCLITMALPLLIPWNVVGTIWQIFGRVDIGLLGHTLASPRY
jgi:glycerol transport system permease protein